MNKIIIEETEKDIINKLIKKLSEVKGKEYQIVYKDYVIELQYKYKDTILFVHSFINNEYENHSAIKALFYYLKGAIEN